MVARSLGEALKEAKKIEKEEIFFIGGAYVYSQAIKIADKLYLTLVQAENVADAFFPEYSNFSLVTESSLKHCEGISYKFTIWKKEGDE